MSDHLVLAADLRCLAQARDWVRARTGSADLTDQQLGDIDLAVTEAVSNVIRHAYGAESGVQPQLDQKIVLEAGVVGPDVVIVIRDRGAAMTEHAPGPDLDDPSDGGYGIYLIESVMDRVQRSREGTSNELRLTKRISSHG